MKRGGGGYVGIKNIITKKNTFTRKKPIKNKQYMFNAKTFIIKIPYMGKLLLYIALNLVTLIFLQSYFFLYVKNSY